MATCGDAAGRAGGSGATRLRHRGQYSHSHRVASISQMLVPLLLATTFLVCPSQACSLHARQAEGGGYNPFEFGGNCTAAPAGTRGYSLNHVSLVTTNLPAMLDFYTGPLGMAHLFSYTPENATFFSIVYLGHNDGVGSAPINGTLFADCATFTAQKNRAKGLLELVAMLPNVSSYAPLPATDVTNTFSHLGLVVPNTTEAEARFRELGVKILKAKGELPGLEGPLANAYGLGKLSTLRLTEEEKRAVVLGLVSSGTLDHVIVADPDGNVVEVQQVSLAE